MIGRLSGKIIPTKAEGRNCIHYNFFTDEKFCVSNITDENHFKDEDFELYICDSEFIVEIFYTLFSKLKVINTASANVIAEIVHGQNIRDLKKSFEKNTIAIITEH
jgi:hypothetical protein